VCLVGGYVAQPTTWFYDIEVRWKRILGEQPKVGYFKAFECEKLIGEFQGLDRELADQKLNRLVDVVACKGTQLMEFSSSIRWDVFEDCVTGGVRAIYDHPYYFCVHGVVSLIAREYVREIALRTGVVGLAPQRVAYVFDFQAQQREMERQYEHVRETVDEVIASTMGSISFRDDVRAPPLQVSDLIAWHLRREILKPRSDGGATRPALLKLRQSYGFDAKEARWNPGKLKAFCAKVDAGLKIPHLWD
jgi:hypothetical protein